jgi:hypothetical protein
LLDSSFSAHSMYLQLCWCELQFVDL